MADETPREDLLRYDILMEDALRGVIRKVMGEVAVTGLPGEHHFYITFLTRAQGVRMSSRLAAQHPNEITIVLQHQYQDLTVTDSRFEVTLYFHGKPERLLVPFAAITAFGDPTVNFGLNLRREGGAGTSEAEELAAAAEKTSAEVEALVKDEPETSAKTADDAKPAKTEDGTASVVSLDAFRKKS